VSRPDFRLDPAQARFSLGYLENDAGSHDSIMIAIRASATIPGNHVAWDYYVA
jgi:hypothetical protein